MLILSLISVWKCKAYLNQQSMKREMCRNFKPEKDGSGDGESEQKQTGFWSGLKRFLPFTSRATLKETYQLPLPDPGMRYHVRLLKPDESLRRHTITRILRFFPDIQWQTAEVLVDIALKKGVSLIRVTNDKVRCEYILIILRPLISFDSALVTRMTQ